MSSEKKVQILNISKEYLHIFEGAKIGIYRVSCDGKEEWANPYLATLSGYDSFEEMFAFIKDIATDWYVDPHRRETFKSHLHNVGKVEDFESEIHQLKTGKRIWISQNAWLVKDEEGKPLYYEGTVEDITPRKHYQIFQENLIRFVKDTLQHGLDESFYQRLLEYATSAIPGVNAGSILIRKEDGLYHYVAVLGYDRDILKDVTFSEQEIIYTPSLEPLIINQLETVNRQTLDTQTYDRLYSAGPLDKIKAMMSLPVLVEGQVMATLSLDTFEASGFSPQVQEMGKSFAAQIGVLIKRLTLEQQLEKTNKELIKLANFDHLTGLPNRLLFADRLEQSFAQARRSGNQVGLLYLDLDGFKDVNESSGHTEGDALLKAVANRLSHGLREEDTVARLGGDEFAIILPSIKNPEDVATIAQKVLDSLSLPFDLQGYDIQVGASIGISLYPEDSYSVEDMLKHADAAIYQAKQSGKNRYSFFTPELNQHILDQIKLENDMRRALTKGEFILHYQPRIHLQTGQITSVEALVRWKHPTRGMISPGVFIPLAEKTGLILPLTRCVLHMACAQAKTWQNEGKEVRVAINLSAKCLQYSELITMLQEPLDHYQLEAKALELEITESVAMEDVESNIRTLNQLKALGFYIAVDDFGTAYSSLNYLKRLPISCLKVDRSFIKDISLKTLSADTAIVKAIIALGKTLEFHLVAEGVETLEQMRFLQLLGCDEAQGFYFCKPLPPEELFKTDHGVLVTSM